MERSCKCLLISERVWISEWKGYDEKTPSSAPITAPKRPTLVVMCESDERHTPEEDSEFGTYELDVLEYELAAEE